MRVTSPARLAVLALLASSSLALVVSSAEATSTAVTPNRVGNDAVKTFSVAGSGFYPASGTTGSQEAVVLKANPANGQADVTGTVTDTGSCSGFTIPGFSNADCAGPLVFTADTTNLVHGTYDVIETRTDMSTSPSTTSSSTVPGPVTVYAQPHFAATTPVAPATRGQDSVSTVTVKGTGFTAGITADFGAGTTVTNLVIASPTQLTVDVTVAPGVPTGTRTVVLTSPDDVTPGTRAAASLAAGFTVTDAPTLTGATPSSGLTGVTQSVTFTGTHLVSGADFMLTIPQVTLAKITVVDASTVTADVTPNVGARSGPRSIFVVNPDGGRGSLVGGFTVIAPPGAPTAVRVQPVDTTVYLAWTAPADSGSGPVTGYRVTTVGGTASAFTGTSAVVTGLTNGTSYSFTVAAKNAEAGFGAESAPVTATPKLGVTLTIKSTPATLVAGQHAVLSGRLTRSTGGTAISGATLTLRFAPQVGRAFTRTVTTAADGTWKDPIIGVFTTAVTATYAGTSDVQARTSTPLVVRVAAHVTVSSPRSGAVSAASSLLSIYGGISPNKAGRTIGLTRLVGTRQQLVARATVARNGTFRFNLRPVRGTYVFTVTIGVSPGNAAGSSARFTVKRT